MLFRIQRHHRKSSDPPTGPLQPQRPQESIMTDLSEPPVRIIRLVHGGHLPLSEPKNPPLLVASDVLSALEVPDPVRELYVFPEQGPSKNVANRANQGTPKTSQVWALTVLPLHSCNYGLFLRRQDMRRSCPPQVHHVMSLRNKHPPLSRSHSKMVHAWKAIQSRALITVREERPARMT